MPVVLILVALVMAPRLGTCPADESQGNGAWRTTAEIARDYLRECFEERDMDGAAALMADDVAFVDPTAEVWGGPAYRGVSGRDTFRKLADSWNIERSHFEVEHSFVSGEFAVFAGAISWQATGAPYVEGVPFCTVLRVEEGQITERTDYGDYDDLLGKDAGAGPLAGSVEHFYEAYAALDLEALDAALAESVVREDPVGASVGRPAVTSGKTDFLASLEQAKEVVHDFEFETSLSFVSGSHAFTFGRAKYTVREGDVELQLEHPYVHVVRFEEGQVVQHRRYLDYAAIDGQVAAQMGSGAGAGAGAGAASDEG